MRKPALALLFLSCSIIAQAQPMHHSGNAVLFLARANGDQVVPRRASAASATAALILGGRPGGTRYELTYNGLEHGSATRIGLYNFDVGGNGKQIMLLCGRGARACPVGRGARLAGTIDTRRWRGPLLSELASGRIYVQIDGGDGKHEIRGQLAANMAMVPSRIYLAHLAPGTEPGAAGAGTAILSETYLPGDRVAVEYHLTVTGTTGRPEAVSLVAAGRPGERALGVLESAPLPNARRQLPAHTQDGATFDGGYTVRSSASSLPLATKMLGTQRPILAVRTSRFPGGELFGEFVPVE